MTIDNYDRLAQENLKRLYETPPADLALRMSARKEGDRYFFRAFGKDCTVAPDGIRLGDRPASGVLGILVSLYALCAGPDPCVVEPLKGFKDLPDSMPYTGAFVSRTQQALVPFVEKIALCKDLIMEAFSGQASGTGGDFGFVLYPLPKIALSYVFYRADEDFPASVTCLYSNNASSHLPTDALADVGEYTSRAILDLVQG